MHNETKTMMKKLTAILLSYLFAMPIVAQTSPYVSRVYEFVPAPGQFVNTAPLYEQGDTEADMIAKASERVVGRVGSTNYISLGAWGGYITVGFDHPVVNIPGEDDLKIYGNALLSGLPDETGRQFGTAEPGIIYVSRDDNGNGLPDDTWYEIAGSEADTANRNYEVTYDKVMGGDIPWTDNAGQTGFILRNTYHRQDSYYPLWLTDEQLVLRGTILPPNTVPVPGSTTPRAFMFGYGYADNWPNSDPRSNIRLDWAVDADGHPANLTHIDFVRVQTGIQVDWGVSGEMSTEFCGAEDLHPEAPMPEGIATPEDTAYDRPQKLIINGQLFIKINNKYYTIL